MPLFRKREQRFRQKSQLLNPEGKFVGFRAEQVSANADHITQIQQMKQREPSLADNVFLYIDLYTLAGTLEMRETSLTHQPQRNEPASYAHFMLFSFQLGR